MADSKKYYWLRLKEDFFDSKHIRYLRSQPDGDKMTIVYLQLQLKSMKTVGVLKYDKLLPSCNEEIAFDLGEPLELINNTISLLKKLNLVEELDDQSLYLSAVKDVVGSETKAAERMRKMRSEKTEDISTRENPFEKYS